jgi:hypothetical protein
MRIIKNDAAEIVHSSRPLFSANIDVRYDAKGEMTAFTVSFFHNKNAVYVLDEDVLGSDGANDGDSAFRFFDWKDPIWTQIRGAIIRKKRKQLGNAWYTHQFSFVIEDDVAGVDYFGLRLKKGMFSGADNEDAIWVLHEGVEQKMAFDTPYFIINPKDAARDVIQIKQDVWMPLLVAAYTLGSAIERRGRPYFSQSIEKIQEWFGFVLGCRQNAAVQQDQATIRKNLISDMIQELWEKGPRRLVAFYSGMGYVFNAMRIGDDAADAIHDFYMNANRDKKLEENENTNDVSPHLFAVMLLLGLRTEKSRLYVTIDLSEQYLQESYTKRNIHELLETKHLMDLFFAPEGRRYAPIKIPKPFELKWGKAETERHNSRIFSLSVSYKDDANLHLIFSLSNDERRCCISLVRKRQELKREWLGRIVLFKESETGVVRFVSESMTSNFRHLRDVNAFKYILLIAAIQYAMRMLHAQPAQLVFEADFFDHCAPYDLMLLQYFGWEHSPYDISNYNLLAAEVSPYSGRAMTLPVVRIPSVKKMQPALVIYLLGPDTITVAVDPSLYRDFVKKLHLWGGWHIKVRKQAGVLIDGVPYRLADTQAFQQFFEHGLPAIHFPAPSTE